MAKFQYTGKQGARLTYDIEVNEIGNFAISRNGQMLRRGHEPLVVLGFLRPGPEREREVLEAARATIELTGMKEG